MPRTYKSEALAAVHEMMEGLHEGGAIDKRTLREFDEACLVPATPLQPEEIRAIRVAEHVSQPVFARYLTLFPIGSAEKSGPAVRHSGCCRLFSARVWRQLRKRPPPNPVFVRSNQHGCITELMARSWSNAVARVKRCHVLTQQRQEPRATHI